MGLNQDEWAELKEKGKRARRFRAEVEEKRKKAIFHGRRKDVAAYELAWRRWQRFKSK